MHIDRQTKELLIEDASTADKPLVVLKFQKRRMLWRLFFPYSIMLPFFFHLITSVAFKKAFYEFLFMEVVFGVAFVGGLYAMVNMFMVKDITLYKDRVVQRFKLSNSERIVYLNNAKYNATQSFYFTVMAISAMDRRWRRIVFNPRLIGTRDKQKFYDMLSNLSGWSIAELINTYPAKKLIEQ